MNHYISTEIQEEDTIENTFIKTRNESGSPQKNRF